MLFHITIDFEKIQYVRNIVYILISINTMNTPLPPPPPERIYLLYADLLHRQREMSTEQVCLGLIIALHQREETRIEGRPNMPFVIYISFIVNVV